MSEVLNVNTASLEELCDLPGVGNSLAERIIASRPYALVEELQNVSGIGPALFERLAPLVAIEDDLEEVVDSVKEVETVLEQDSADKESDEMEDEVDSDLPEEDHLPEGESPLPEAEAPPNVGTSVTRRQSVLYSLGCSVVAIVISLALMLAIFAGINGGLRYAHASQFAILEQQIVNIETQIDELDAEMDELQSVVTNLEDMAGQVDQLEQEFAEVVHVADALIQEIESIRGEANRFESFMDGLREILNTIFESEEP